MGFLREPSHLLLIGIVILVLFGGKKLPEAARGLGRSLRIFKSEVKAMKDDDPDDPPAGTGPLEGRVVGQGEPSPTPPAPAAQPPREPEPVRSADERRPGL